MPAIHALTGCDTTSSVSGIGKTDFTKLIRNKDKLLGLKSYGLDNDLEKDITEPRKKKTHLLNMPIDVDFKMLLGVLDILVNPDYWTLLKWLVFGGKQT